VQFLTLDWTRGVDGERYIEIIKPIPTTSAGKRFELRRETIGAYDKGIAGLVLEEQTLLIDADSGEIYTKFIGSSFMVGQVPRSPPPVLYFSSRVSVNSRAATEAPKVPKSPRTNDWKTPHPPKPCATKPLPDKLSSTG
jgi:hypothetical protein